MIDYLKFELNDYILHNSDVNLKLTREFVRDTGEVLGNHYKIETDGMRIRLYDSGRIFIDGSLHRYYNSGGKNYDDFTFEKVKLAIKKFSENIGFNISCAELHNLEYGVNIEPPIPSREILSGLMFYRTTPFKDNRLSTEGSFKAADLQRFSIKCYDKRAHCKLKEELLRFEIHVKKMAHLEKYDIKYFADLVNPNKLELLGKDLEEKWNQILFFDMKLFQNSKSSRLKNERWSNPVYWKLLRVKYSNSRKYIMFEKEKLNDYTLKFGANTKGKVSERLLKKWDELMRNKQTIQLNS